MMQSVKGRVAVNKRILGAWVAAVGIWLSAAGVVPVLSQVQQSGLTAASSWGWAPFLLGYSALVVFAAAAFVRVARQERSVNPFRGRAHE